MGLIARILGFLTGQSARLDQLASILKARLDGPDGPATLGLASRHKPGFDRLMDALNRLPRPLMALGIVVIMAAALIDPVWFAARMEALAQIPEPLWWLIGAIVSLFFGARFQTHEQQFTRELVGALTNTSPPSPASDQSPLVATTASDARLTLHAETPGENAALAQWGSTKL